VYWCGYWYISWCQVVKFMSKFSLNYCDEAFLFEEPPTMDSCLNLMVELNHILAREYETIDKDAARGHNIKQL